MKKVKGILASAMMLVFLISISPQQTKAAPPVSVSFQFFYDNLSPYGAWVSYSNYGYAWVPRVSGFRPYASGGHWVFTDAGWMWASSYDWGWAPFHYGSWAYDPYYGWLWVPGYDWAPAWVTWGYYDGYYGWAPLAPGISFSIGYYPPIDYWVFTSPGYMTVNNFNNNYYVYSGNRIPLGDNTSITNVKSINVVDNTASYSGKTYSAGPSRTDYKKVARTDVKAVSIRENDKPGKSSVSSDAVSVYRPKVSGDKSAAKPAKVTPLENIKRSDAERARETGKTREPANKIAPDRKNDVRERQLQRDERKPEMKEQPRQERQKPEIREQPKERKPEMREQPQERKPEMKEQPQQNEKPKREVQQEERPRQEMQQRQSEPKREAAPSQQRTEKPQREERPNMERQAPPGTPKQDYQQRQQQQRQEPRQQPQQRERPEKRNPK